MFDIVRDGQPKIILIQNKKLFENLYSQSDIYLMSLFVYFKMAITINNEKIKAI